MNDELAADDDDDDESFICPESESLPVKEGEGGEVREGKRE